MLPWRLPQTERGHRPLTLLNTAARDAGVEIGDLSDVMLDRTVWRNIVEQFRSSMAQSKVSFAKVVSC